MSSEEVNVTDEVIAEPIKWICLDDGTGRNVFYISPTGERRRNRPAEFEPEYLLNGKRRYYFRGSCIRCRKKITLIALFGGPGGTAYSMNYCEDCLIATSPGVSRLRGQGGQIALCNEDTPMTCLYNYKERVLDPSRSSVLIERSKSAKFKIATASKIRRNEYRYNRMLDIKNQYGLKNGEYVSWGFDNNGFDEYFGELDEHRLPHGN